MKLIFFIVAFTILISINSYVALRGWQALPNASALRPIYLISVILLFLSLVFTMSVGEYLPHNIAKIIALAGFTYVIVFIYLMISFLVVDVIRIANYFFHFLPAGMASFRLWVMAGTLAVTAVAMVVGSYKFNHPSVVTLNLNLDKPTQNKALKVVAVSDIHVGVTIDKARLQQYVALINEQQPDIVLMAGDISDRSIKPIINQKMNEEFRSIKSRYGVYAINGNHEHYAEQPNATSEYLESAGVKVLKDASVLIDSSFYIVGRDDRTNPNRKELSTIVAGLREDLPKILLDHQPYHLDEAEKNKIDLQFSGHTHNGQFFPGNLFVKRMYELGYGYLKKGNTHYYVSSGLGIWGPQYRIGTQSEIVVINIKY